MLKYYNYKINIGRQPPAEEKMKNWLFWFVWFLTLGSFGAQAGDSHQRGRVRIVVGVGFGGGYGYYPYYNHLPYHIDTAYYGLGLLDYPSVPVVVAAPPQVIIEQMPVYLQQPYQQPTIIAQPRNPCYCSSPTRGYATSEFRPFLPTTPAPQPQQKLQVRPPAPHPNEPVKPLTDPTVTKATEAGWHRFGEKSSPNYANPTRSWVNPSDGSKPSKKTISTKEGKNGKLIPVGQQ